MEVSRYSLAVAVTLLILCSGCATQRMATTVPAGANVANVGASTIPAGPGVTASNRRMR